MTKHPAVPDRWMSVPDAAKLLGVTRQTVYARIAKGKLKADVVVDRLLVRRDSVTAALSPKES